MRDFCIAEEFSSLRERVSDSISLTKGGVEWPSSLLDLLLTLCTAKRSKLDVNFLATYCGAAGVGGLA